MTILRLVLLAWLAMSVVAGAHAQQKPTGGQNEILDAARRMTELAAAQNKSAIDEIQATSRMAIDQNNKALEHIKAVSSSAIDTAKATNEHAQKTFDNTTHLLAAIVAVLAFIGWYDRRTSREDFNKQISAIRDAGAEEVKAFREKAEAQLLQIQDRSKKLDGQFTEFESRSKQLKVEVDDRFMIAASVGIDTATFISAREPLLRETNKSNIRADAIKDLFDRLNVIEGKAGKLDDKRTISWVETNRALLNHHIGKSQQAVAHQLASMEYKFTEQPVRFDRWRNLACMAYKHFELSGDADALALCNSTLTELQGFIVSTQVATILDETELRAFFKDHPHQADAFKALQ